MNLCAVYISAQLSTTAYLDIFIFGIGMALPFLHLFSLNSFLLKVMIMEYAEEGVDPNLRLSQ